MKGSVGTGLTLLVGALLLAVVISIGLYRWDAGARAVEASLRPQPVAPLAVSSPVAQPTPAAGAQAAVVSPGTGDAATGEAVFKAGCNGCHPNANAGIGPALHGQAFMDRYSDNAVLTAVIRGGRGGMPAFGPDRLSDPDLANLIAYVRSLPAAPEAAAAIAPTAPARVAATAPPPVPAPAAAASAVAASPTPLSQQLLSSITPGLSSYMLETARRMGRSWFAAKDTNWDEAAFEIREGRGVLQQGAARSSAVRQQALSAFNDGFMTPLVDAAQSEDRAQYELAYRAAIGGCNACHVSQASGAGLSFGFIRVQVPTSNIWEVYAYAK
jgi:mono/diheme cytochrome c family protein